MNDGGGRKDDDEDDEVEVKESGEEALLTARQRIDYVIVRTFA